MGLSPQQQAILDQAKYGTGGISFISDVSKIDVINEPILIVGLGGTGIDAMLRVKAKINETFRTGINPNNGMRKTVPDNIRFIGVDTDKKSFVDPETGTSSLKYRGMFVEEDETLNIGSKTLASYFEYATNNNVTYITDWVSPNLNTQDATEGAAGVRQISRLCLFEQFQKVHGKFTSVIGDLISADSANEKKLSVYILGGISGGTGSGTFIDIPYIIQSAAKAAMGISEAANIWQRLSIMGYFVTPDINYCNHPADRIKINGYAALKELDYLMGIEERGETFKQNYTATQEIRSSRKPYGLVNFVSSTFIDGTPVSNPYDSALQVIAENIIFFISNEPDSTFGALSFQNNVNTEINQMIAHLENTNNVKPVAYRYGILGASGKILPVQDIMTCLASHLFDDINDMWEKHGEPTDQEVNLIIGPSQFAFDQNSLINLLQNGIVDKFSEIKNNPMNYPQSTKEAIKHGGNAASDFEMMFNHHKTRIQANFANDNFKKGLEGNFLSKLEGFFTNTAPNLIIDPTNPNAPTTYGPKFANDILVGVEGGTNLNCLKYCAMQKNKLTGEYNAISDKLTNMFTVANTLRQNTEKAIVSSTEKYNKYMEEMENIYSLKERQELCLVLIDAYTFIQKLIDDANHKIFGTIYSTLTSLRAIFDKNMDIMGNIDVRKTYEGSVMSWYVVNFTTVNETISEMLANKDISVSATNLYKEIWKNREDWSADGTDITKYQVVEEISDFLAFEFSEQLNTGLEEYIRAEFEKSNNTGTYKDFADYIKRKFDSELTNSAAIMFNPRDGFATDAGGPMSEGGTIPGRLYVQVPAECSEILTALTAKHGTSNTAKSANKSRIIYNNSLYGYPLYTFGLIEDYEKEYEATLASNSSAGLHIYQKGDTNWADLPAICHPKTYSIGYNNMRERERIADAEAVFDKAIEYGVIRQSTDGLYYFAHFAGNLDLDAMIKEAGNNIATLQKLYNDLKLYVDGKAYLPADFGKYTNSDGFEEVRLQKSVTLESAKFWFPSSYELIKRVKAENDKYDKITQTLKEVKVTIASFERYYVFAKALLTEVIVNRGPKYYYVPNNEGLEPVELARKAELANSACAEYEIFDLLFNKNKLPQNQQGFLIQDVQTKFAEFEDSDYDSVYCPTIDNLVEKLTQNARNIEFNANIFANSEEILNFYNILINYLKGIR